MVRDPNYFFGTCSDPLCQVSKIIRIRTDIKFSLKSVAEL